MKILLIHNTYQLKGGEDSVLQNEYELLKENDNDVELLLYDNDSIKSFADKLKVGLFAVYNNKSAKLLRQKIKQFEPDIIHVHNFFPIASPSVFYVANKMKIPIVMTLHNYRLICPNALLLRNGKICELCTDKAFPINGVIHACYRKSRIQTFILAFMSFLHKKTKTWKTRVNKYIALTDFAKDKIVNSSLRLSANKVIVKPNFVNDFGFKTDKLDYFLFVGRLSEEKGIDLLLDAFIDTKNKIEIVGNGPLHKKVLDFSIKHDNIICHGFKNKDFILKKLKNARALILSSICYEGMPMTILESLSVATPVIVPNIGGPNEMIENGINGLVYKSNDLNSLQEKIELMRNNDLLHDKLCKEARLTYENKYSPEKNYDQLMKIYNNLIND